MMKPKILPFSLPSISFSALEPSIVISVLVLRAHDRAPNLAPAPTPGNRNARNTGQHADFAAEPLL